MRRVLAIFLILLFPLNVFALSMSAATLAQPAEAKTCVHHVAGAIDALDDIGAGDGIDGDIDPDEPPAGADLHYIVGHDGSLQFGGLAASSVTLHDAAPRCHAIAPPVKPPRAA